MSAPEAKRSCEMPSRLGDCQYRHDWIDGKCNTCGQIADAPEAKSQGEDESTLRPDKTTAVDDARTPIPEIPEPKFKVGQVVVMGSLKKKVPFRILSAEWFDDTWFYGWNARNASSEGSLRALTPQERGGVVDDLTTGSRLQATVDRYVKALKEIAETRNAVPGGMQPTKSALIARAALCVEEAE